MDRHHLKIHPLHTSAEFRHSKNGNQDLQEGRVMPPQQAAIIMYSNRTITNVNSALSQIRETLYG